MGSEEKKKKEKTGLFKGLMMAYTILILHVLLIALVGCVVLFFKGVTDYMTWILAGCAGLILLSGYYFYRRIIKEGRNLRRTLHSPMFEGRPVEISFMGGLASFKMGAAPNPNGPMALEGGEGFPPLRQLEDPATARIRELKELARLLENDLITIEEYKQTKQELFNRNVAP